MLSSAFVSGGPQRRLGLYAMACLVILAILAIPGVARGAYNHSTVETEFSAGSGCETVTDIAVDEASGYLYVACTSSLRSIRKFNLAGEPVNFSGSSPYISGNQIIGSAGSPGGKVGTRIAVDNSSVHPGYIYVVTGPVLFEGQGVGIDVYGPDGTWLTDIPAKKYYTGRKESIDVGVNGHIYVVEDGSRVTAAHVTEYNPDFSELHRLYTLLAGRFLGIDSSGAAWVASAVEGGAVRISKYEHDQFISDLLVELEEPDNVLSSVEAHPSPFFTDPLLQGTGISGIDVSPNTDELFVDRGNRVESFTAGSSSEPPFANAPAFGSGTLVGAGALAVTADQRVYVAKPGGTVVEFGPGNILADIATPSIDADQVGHTSATVEARIDPAGGTHVINCKVAYGLDKSYSGPDSGEVSCVPDPSGSPFSEPITVTAQLTGLVTGDTYHYRFTVTNSTGSSSGADRTIHPASVLKVHTLGATNVELNQATLQGTLDPDGVSTDYHFEYGATTTYGLETATTSAGEGNGATAVSTVLNALPSGKTLHYRLVASNNTGTTYGEDRTVRTAAPPDVTGVRATELTGTGATLSARIDPLGYDTEYRFEYGTSSAYGRESPVPAGQLTGSGAAETVSTQLTGLEPGTTYHFRIVALNEWGASESADTTFDYSPPECPNDTLRQMTNSSYLPDCRAYELVSPASASGIQLLPSNAAHDKAEEVNSRYGEEMSWVVNTGRATAPAAFAFFGQHGSLEGIDAPNNKRPDMYMATRATSGWTTSLPGLTGSHFSEVGRQECSGSLQLCVSHNEGGFGLPPEAAPYLFRADGSSLGRLPTNLAIVPGGEYFEGAQRMSGDFSHFLFASTNVKFTPDGVIGGVGSAYDNNVQAHTVLKISTRPDGSDISGSGLVNRSIEFPGVSEDASHILMETEAADGGVHLFMRVDDAVTYEIAPGKSVQFAGMTRDGSKVVFASDERLTEADTDSSRDLYMWTETGELRGQPLTLISAAGSRGNGDECAASWVEKCGIALLNTERSNPHGLPDVPGLDDSLAESAGDIYFYSPESLDGERPGIRNQRNLYVFHDGEVHLVGTLDPGTEVNRIQISPDGLHAALLTSARLSSYDNKGFSEMYEYAATSGQIRCVSCNPDGSPPTGDVEASQGGRFMTDDGRPFFATKDALVPRDTDGGIIDVYEYVGGRPQLITSGSGSRDFTGGSRLVVLDDLPEHTGLEGVSRNGRDVYFSTFDTLVPQDRNGQSVKFYDARTDGGFAPEPSVPPCAAADECHEAGTSAPPAASIGTDSVLGGGSSSSTQPGRKVGAHKHRKAHKRRHKRHRGHSRRRARHGNVPRRGGGHG